MWSAGGGVWVGEGVKHLSCSSRENWVQLSRGSRYQNIKAFVECNVFSGVWSFSQYAWDVG